MNFQTAARQIVERTAYSVITGTAAPGEQEAAEAQALAAIADSVGKSEASVTGIARALYWKFNPIGTVPPSYYDDSNFQPLRAALMRAAAGQSLDEPSEPEISAEDLQVIDSMAAPSEAIERRVDPKEFSKSFADNVAVEAEQAIDSAKPEAKTVEGDAKSALGSIQDVLSDFVRDLGGVFTVKPEWYGREAEGISTPVASAAMRILEIWTATARAELQTKPIKQDLTEDAINAIVPKDWSLSVARDLYNRLDTDLTVEWVSNGREQAVEKTALNIGRWIAELVHANNTTVIDSLGNEIGIGFPKEWSEEVAQQLLAKLIVNDFSYCAMGIGATVREGLKTFLSTSVFENVSPTVAFRYVADAVGKDVSAKKASAPEVTTTAVPERREAWKMPWSVASRIVADLCQRSSDETAFLSQFKDWLSLPSATNEEIRNELVSEIVIVGREQPASDEKDVVKGEPIQFVYENWRGEIEVRKAIPVRMTFGSNEWHKEPTWLIEAFDLKHDAMRTFAAKGIIKFL